MATVDAITAGTAHGTLTINTPEVISFGTGGKVAVENRGTTVMYGLLDATDLTLAAQGTEAIAPGETLIFYRDTGTAGTICLKSSAAVPYSISRAALPRTGGGVASSGGGVASEVSLDASTLAALESITVVDGGGTLSVDDGAGSLTVDGTVAATQSGTWTVQPGNTANTTAWKVDGSAVTQPVSDGGSSLTVDGTVTSDVGSGTRPVAGSVAAAATDSGNPVKVGGKYNSTLPTYTDGQRGDAQLDSRGGLRVTGMASNATAIVGAPIVIGGYDGTNARFAGLGVSSGDGVVNTTSRLIVDAYMNGLGGTTWDRIRVANLLATVTATASGDTAVVTPTSGKKVRVVGYSIEVTANAATSGGGVVEVILRDSSTALGLGTSVFCPSAAGTTFGPNASTGWRTLGNGKLSAAANNVLNVNLSAALSAGQVRVNVAYTEE